MYLFTGYLPLFLDMFLPLQGVERYKAFAASLTMLCPRLLCTCLLEHFFTMQGPHAVLKGFVGRVSL